MNDSVTKKWMTKEEISRFNRMTSGISPEYYKRQAEQRARWAKEDAEKASFNSPITIITNVEQPKKA